METTNNKTFAQKITDALHKALTELEELQVQAALGKAEAKELYEEAKKKFNAYLHEASNNLKNSASNIQTDAEKIKALLEEIQVQLALGKAETKEAFEEQRKSLMHFIAELETCIRGNKMAGAVYADLLLELEKFRLKLEILKLRYELKKMEVKEDFEEKKKKMKDKINEMKERLFSPDKDEHHQWEHFQKEVGLAYQHLKQAFGA